MEVKFGTIFTCGRARTLEKHDHALIKQLTIRRGDACKARLPFGGHTTGHARNARAPGAGNPDHLNGRTSRRCRKGKDGFIFGSQEPDLRSPYPKGQGSMLMMRMLDFP